MLFQFILSLFLFEIEAVCNVCQSSNGVACHSNQRFSICRDGFPTKEFKLCPGNSICTSGPNVCYPINSDTVPSCLKDDVNSLSVEDKSTCGVCDANKVFACLNETTIAFCFGASVPNLESLSYCPKNTVCDITNEKYCSNSSLAEPTCITIEETTTSNTTPAGPRDPDAICKDAGRIGLHKADDDKTCTKYVVCYAIGDQLKGLPKTCPSGQYFHPEKKICSEVKPAECS